MQEGVAGCSPEEKNKRKSTKKQQQQYLVVCVFASYLWRFMLAETYDPNSSKGQGSMCVQQSLII